MLPTGISEKGYECWSAQEVGIDSAERTAGRDKAKLNSPVRRQGKNGSVRTA